MPEFRERYLRFSFGESWQVEKYDETDGCAKLQKAIDGTKAIDLVAIESTNSSVLYLIEIKDFRRFSIAERQEVQSGDLVFEIAQKVRDTLPGLIGAWRTSSQSHVWKPYVERLLNPETEIRIVVWLELDPGSPNQNSRSLKTIGNELKKKLRWLTTKIIVVNSIYGHVPKGLNVASLSRNPPPPN